MPLAAMMVRNANRDWRSVTKSRLLMIVGLLMVLSLSIAFPAPNPIGATRGAWLTHDALLGDGMIDSGHDWGMLVREAARLGGHAGQAK